MDAQPMKIKTALYLAVFGFATIIAQPGFSQEGNPVFASVETKLEPVKISETPPSEARANTFWYHYDNYRDHVLTNTLREHEALKHLSQTTRSTNHEVALLNGMRMI